MPEPNKVSLSQLADALIQDLQEIAAAAAPLETREALEALPLPQRTRKICQGLTTAVNTERQRQDKKDKEAIQRRREALQLGLQQRQLLFDQSVSLRQEKLQRPISGKFVVTGRIVDDETGLGLPNVTVKAFDRDRQYDDFLGTVMTDADGFYRLEYAPEQFQESGENAPEIYVQVVGETDTPLYQSPRSVEIKSAAVETINVRVSSPELSKNKARAEQIEKNRSRDRDRLAEKQQRLRALKPRP